MKSCPARGALLTRLISMVLIGLLALSLTACAKVPAEGAEAAEPALESVTAAAPEPEAVPTPAKRKRKV